MAKARAHGNSIVSMGFSPCALKLLISPTEYLSVLKRAGFSPSALVTGSSHVSYKKTGAEKAFVCKDKGQKYAPISPNRPHALLEARLLGADRHAVSGRVQRQRIQVPSDLHFQQPGSAGARAPRLHRPRCV